MWGRHGAEGAKAAGPFDYREARRNPLRRIGIALHQPDSPEAKRRR